MLCSCARPSDFLSTVPNPPKGRRAVLRLRAHMLVSEPEEAWEGDRAGYGGPDPEIPNSRSPDESPIWSGIGEGIRDSRLGRNRESGNPPFPDLAGSRESGSQLAANREIGDTPRCEYIMHDPGLDVVLSPSNADSGLPPHFSTA